MFLSKFFSSLILPTPIHSRQYKYPLGNVASALVLHRWHKPFIIAGTFVVLLFMLWLF